MAYHILISLWNVVNKTRIPTQICLYNQIKEARATAQFTVSFEINIQLYGHQAYMSEHWSFWPTWILVYNFVSWRLCKSFLIWSYCSSISMAENNISVYYTFIWNQLWQETLLLLLLLQYYYLVRHNTSYFEYTLQLRMTQNTRLCCKTIRFLEVQLICLKNITRTDNLFFLIFNQKWFRKRKLIRLLKFIMLINISHFNNVNKHMQLIYHKILCL